MPRRCESHYEEDARAVLRAMPLGKNMLSPTISRDSGVSRGRCISALHVLMKRGLVERQEIRGAVYYVAVRLVEVRT